MNPDPALPLPPPPPGSPAENNLPSVGPPLTSSAGLAQLLETLLKRPPELILELQRKGSARLAVLLAVTALVLLAIYGLIIGSFSGGAQWLAAPLKLCLGTAASALICLPSLFIFACLSGAEVSSRGLVGVLRAITALTALLLIGFAPVAWIFSQSTDALVVMGTLHLCFWLISLGFGLRLLTTVMRVWRVADQVHLHIWKVIFILVCLQMTTALRPIIGTSAHWLPIEKKFFLVHWGDHLFR